MVKTGINNLEASIHARLLNISKETGENFNAILNRFFQERFLARLSMSDFKKFFILKGGLLLATQSIAKFRPTIDIDMLAVNIKNDVEILKPIIIKITQISMQDCVCFNTQDMLYETLRTGDEYEGIRFKFSASLGKIRSRVQIDIGFGDDVPSGFKERIFPVFLNDFESPVLLTYPLESVIAEKFHAIVYFGEANSRMKDFYDIQFLAEHNEFIMLILHTAITATFAIRKTDIENRFFIYTEEYIKLKSGLWLSFMKKMNCTEPTSFMQVVRIIKEFIEPAVDGSNADSIWNHEKMNWKDHK